MFDSFLQSVVFLISIPKWANKALSNCKWVKVVFSIRAVLALEASRLTETSV